VSTKGKINKLFGNSRIKVNSELDDRILAAAFQNLNESETITFTAPSQQLWRVILKSPISRLAAFVIVIFAAVLGISLLNKPVTKAYNVEQTIDAMRKASTIHCSIKTFMEEQYEAWIELNPQTGEFKNIFMESPEVIKVATPDGISAYYKNTNEVVYFKQNSDLVYEMYFRPLIQDIADIAKSNSSSKIQISEGRGEKPVITVTLDKNEATLEWKVDAETKLPISMSQVSKEVLLPMKFNQSINNLSFNAPLPQGIFDFKIPKGAKVREDPFNKPMGNKGK
jgi:outer membrane lipoprotein-sorting protein